MQFSDTSNKLGIIQYCEEYCSLGDAGISGNTTRLKQFTSKVNEINRRVWAIIFDAYGGWQYDDSNQTDLPAATDTLTSGQTSYALPSAALTVRGIEVKDQSGVWTALRPLTEEMIREVQPMGEFLKTSSNPQYYQLVGQTVRIFPASNYTQSSSFKVFFDRGSVAFASSDTTASPGFASEFHGIIPIGASYEYLMAKQPNDAVTTRLKNEYNEYRESIKKFYSRKFSEMFPPRIKTADIIREYT